MEQNETAKKVKSCTVSNKKDTEIATYCFDILKVSKDSKCPHGLTFFQCMPCSH